MDIELKKEQDTMLRVCTLYSVMAMLTGIINFIGLIVIINGLREITK